MSIRSLALVVLALVAGVALSVDWYLDGEREVRAETRAQPTQHLPRVAPEAAPLPTSRVTRRSLAPSHVSSSAPVVRAAALWVAPVEEDTASTALDPR